MCESHKEKIERLQADLKERDAVCDSYADENQRFHDEIERLQAEIRELRRDNQAVRNRMMDLDEIIAKGKRA